MQTISERLRADDLLYHRGPNYEPLPVKPSAVRLEAAETIDTLVAALGLVRSMRAVDGLAPAVHDFEIAKRQEAWAKIDAEINAALTLAARTVSAQKRPTSTETNVNEQRTEGDSGMNRQG